LEPLARAATASGRRYELAQTHIVPNRFCPLDKDRRLQDSRVDGGVSPDPLSLRCISSITYTRQHILLQQLEQECDNTCRREVISLRPPQPSPMERLPPSHITSSVGFSASSYSPPPLSSRKSVPSALTTALPRHRFSGKLSPTSLAPVHSPLAALSTASSLSDAIHSEPELTDDPSSSASPIDDCSTTPPATPPMSDLSGSPRRYGDSSAWKKLGHLSGCKPSRKRSQLSFDLHTT
jgi:hypothetical protein